MKYKVLIIEDDPDMGGLLQRYLEFSGFEVARVYNGEEARADLAENCYDVLVVDIMMPKEDGLLFAKKLKDTGNNTPFIFLTARKMQEDIIKGLQLGADDYILKPFDPDELILRINNILRRTQKQSLENKQGAIPLKKQYQIGSYVFEPSNLLLSSSTTNKILTEKESDLLLYLFENSNQLIKREDILNYLWEEADFFKGRSMDVFISRLRKYLAEDSGIQIESVRGIGFRFIV